MIKNRPLVLDMFCGCGGLSRGFMDAGYDVVLGIDHDEAALKTFKANHGNAEARKLDLFLPESIDEIEKIIDGKSIDVLVGGPPCQGFSLAGTRQEDDDRNKLYKAMVEVARRVRPKIVVIENVPGLAKLYKGKAKTTIYEDFEGLGYTMNDKVLYAPEYGIPQIRKRIFFVGILNGKEKFEYPEPTHTEENFISCKDAIGDLPPLNEDLVGETPTKYPMEPMTEYQKLMRKNSDILHNHIGTKHTDKVVHLISLVPEGKNYKSLPKELQEGIKYNESLTRYHSEKPSRTIDTGHRTHFHYKWNRIPTARENARLQSFPDDFILHGNKTQQYRQVGNAVPPMLGYHLGKQILNYLDNDEN
ncbi:DNA cytosine methyltransferase [Paraclostridium sordellii]|uniref:DNA cytosine methyltransferase n=1 Tax=Paraclostridium sordellii TaxID=1505 RepID=UPI0005E6AE95|nr:DNA cytosine methyltransferase [Paeniclostridium sordellii]CEP43703.1 DNA-cytosine methyltransferase [[Clostridium] sordellii] [Paeniclostridium sordellii]